MENLSPQILRGVVREMTELVKGAPEGIRVHMNDEDITDIQATITGPGTVYPKDQFCVLGFSWLRKRKFVMKCE